MTWYKCDPGKGMIQKMRGIKRKLIVKRSNMNVRVCKKTSHNRGQEEVHSAPCLALKISSEAEMTLVAAESRIALASFLEIEGQARQRDPKELWTQCPREPISMVWRLANQSLLSS